MDELKIIKHAWERMQEYDIDIETLTDALSSPDYIFIGYNNRKIYQKRLDGHLLRAVVEEYINVKRVITVYKARRDRYDVQV
jgi:hypothetical protein